MFKRIAVPMLLLLSLAIEVYTEEFSFTKEGFSIQLPDQWEAIPADTMQQLYPNMLAGWWVAGQTGIDAQILVSLLESGPLPVPDDSLIKSMVSQLAKDFLDIDYRFDADTGIIWISGVQKTGSITIRSIMASKLTSSGLLLLVFNTTPSAYRLRREEFLSAVANLKLSPEAVWRAPGAAPHDDRYSQNSIYQDFTRYAENESYQFTTKGHPKSLGVSLKISIPADWEMKEGERPHIIQKFTSKSYDSKVMMCIISINKVPAIVSILNDEDIAEMMFSDEAVSESLPQGSELTFKKITRYDGQPGLFIAYSNSAQRAGFDLRLYVAEHRFIYKKRHISVSCSYSGTNESFKGVEIENEIQAFQLLSQMIANSIVIDKW